MSGRGEQPSIVWAGKGILATALGEGVVRYVSAVSVSNVSTHLQLDQLEQ